MHSLILIIYLLFLEDSELVVDGYIIPQPPLALVYHKPKDVISAMKDSRYCLGDALQGKPKTKYFNLEILEFLT